MINLTEEMKDFMKTATKSDLEITKIGLNQKDLNDLQEITEITGKHEDDYESEVPFESNWNEDWLEP